MRAVQTQCKKGGNMHQQSLATLLKVDANFQCSFTVRVQRFFVSSPQQPFLLWTSHVSVYTIFKLMPFRIEFCSNERRHRSIGTP